MMNIEQVRSRLKDRLIGVVAKAVGVSSRTVAYIRDGRNCSAETLEKLSNYFEEREVRK